MGKETAADSLGQGYCAARSKLRLAREAQEAEEEGGQNEALGIFGELLDMFQEFRVSSRARFLNAFTKVA